MICKRGLRIQKVRPRVLTAGIIAAVLLFPLPVNAAATNGSNIDYIGGSTGNMDSETPPAGAPNVTAFGDAWEVTLYIGTTNPDAYKGSYLLYGPQTIAAAQNAGANDEERIKFIRNLDWGKSGGQKHSTNGAGGGLHKLKDDKCPRWNLEAEIAKWGTEKEKVADYVIQPLYDLGFGSLSQEYKEKIIDQFHNPPTEEEIGAGAEYVDWCVSMEPVQLLKYNVTVVSGDGIRGGEKFELNKREEFYDKWIASERCGRNGWYNISQALSNPYISKPLAKGVHNQPHDWYTDRGWYTTNHHKDNYYLFFPDFNGIPPEEEERERQTTTTKIDPEVGFDEIWILEKEILANIQVDWNKDDVTNSNVLAENIELIKIKEKTNTEGGLRVHENKSAGTCGYVEHNDDEEGDCTDACKECTDTLMDGIQCDQEYTFTWTQNPKAKMDEADLKTESNVVGTDSSLNNPFNGTKAPTIYQMTRVDGIMDLEFSKKNDVFKEYTWNNSQPGGTQKKGPTGAYSYTSDTSYAQPSGDEPKPFNAGFQVSFNSHRFAKWGKDDALAAAGGDIRSFLPLAGYMMDTDANDYYKDWVDERGLLTRIAWILQEDEPEYIEDMYTGSPGLNFTWGHGGQHGTNSGSSDLVWNNEWKWSRTAYYNRGTVSATHSTPNHTVKISHEHTCDDDSSKSGIEADALETPRACFGRTELIEDTIRGHKNTNLLKGTSGNYPEDRTQPFDNSSLDDEEVQYFIRENQWKNDRVTFTIPSTIFEFSPTYKMYADYTLNTTRKDYEDVWMLATDTDTIQFRDVLDFDLQGGDTVVRAPWSRDYDDLKATDPNTGKPINVLKSGSAYHVDTSNSRLVVTGIVHYWDETFFEYDSDEYRAAKADNEIVDAYIESITEMLELISDEHFGFYTNLVGGTTYGSKFRDWPGMNAEIFSGASFSTRAKGNMAIPDPMGDYPKLQLTVNLSHGYVENTAVVTAASVLDEYRLNGGWDVWDSVQAQDSELWEDPTLLQYIPDMNIHSATRLETILVKGLGTVEKWYIEDYEGLLITVIRGHIDIPAIRSNPATVYEKLSDFNSDMNQWSPEMKHPIIQVGTTGARGHGNNILIQERSIGAGTYLDMPPITIYPGGMRGDSKQIHNWSICYQPYLFGLRGSLFDNAA